MDCKPQGKVDKALLFISIRTNFPKWSFVNNSEALSTLREKKKKINAIESTSSQICFEDTSLQNYSLFALYKASTTCKPWLLYTPYHTDNAKKGRQLRM